MKTLKIRIRSRKEAFASLKAKARKIEKGEPVAREAVHGFASYERVHKVLTPKRVEVVKAMAGQGALSVRDIARRVGRDVKAVHTDLTALVEAGIVDRSDEGFVFPFDAIEFDFKLSAAA